MLEIRDVCVSYTVEGRRVAALQAVDLTIDRGDICALIGPSGCGKSTLLHVIAGLCPDYTGEVRLDGKPVDRRRLRIGFIQQDYGLLDWATVYDNVLLGLRIKKDDLRSRRDEIEAMLESLGLTALRKKYPGQLSGGERQRVSIAQSFLLKPDILLMDEPFSALDALNREKMQELFLSIWQEHRVSAIFVTHSIDEALMVGRHIAILSKAPGSIVSVRENALFGRENLRLSPDFYAETVALRETVGGLWL